MNAPENKGEGFPDVARKSSIPARRTGAAGVRLSHASPDGSARMVDVGDKGVTERSAGAEGFVRVSRELARQIRGNLLRKGSVLETARLAGIMGAKRTSELVPLCHPISLDAVDVEARLRRGCVHVTARVRTHARTGVEIEALCAVLTACLTVVDMGKSVDRGMVVEGVRILEKHGGRSGAYVAPRRGARRKRP